MTEKPKDAPKEAVQEIILEKPKEPPKEPAQEITLVPAGPLPITATFFWDSG